MRDKKNWISGLILVGLMIVTFYVLLRDQPLTKLSEVIGRLKPGVACGRAGADVPF